MPHGSETDSCTSADYEAPCIEAVVTLHENTLCNKAIGGPNDGDYLSLGGTHYGLTTVSY